MRLDLRRARRYTTPAAADAEADGPLTADRHAVVTEIRTPPEFGITKRIMSE